MTTLIVDDEFEIGFILNKILTKANLECSIVASFNEAKQSLSRDKYDIIFLDVNLKDGSGLDLMPLIKAEQEDQRVVIMSAYDDALQKAQSRFGDKVRIMKKPFSKDDVLKTVDLIRAI